VQRRINVTVSTSDQLSNPMSMQLDFDVVFRRRSNDDPMFIWPSLDTPPRAIRHYTSIWPR